MTILINIYYYLYVITIIICYYLLFMLEFNYWNKFYKNEKYYSSIQLLILEIEKS
jgi:hypothetical protein